MADLVALGAAVLPGEVVAVGTTAASVQAYEYTGGLAVGDPATALGRPLSARLGPWLLGGVFDGLLRPLDTAPTWLVPASDRPRGADRSWPWRPSVAAGAVVGAGDVLGTVPGAGSVAYRVLVPPGASGRVERVVAAGEQPADRPVAVVAGRPVLLGESWPVRRPRPVRG